MIYPVDGGFVISDDCGWLPGVYASTEAARMSLYVDLDVLQDLNDRICHIKGEDRSMTVEDLSPHIENYVSKLTDE